MPDKKTTARVRKAKRQGKSPSTQAGEYVRGEIDEIRAGKHGARSTKQVIAIGLSKARRAGVKLAPPKKGTVSEETRRKAARDMEKGQSGHQTRTNPKRSKATTQALKRESGKAASHEALSKQAKQQAKKRTAKERSAIAKKAVKTRAAHVRTSRKKRST